jgi:hypothetical protein
MDAKELRIGNKLSFLGQTVTVKGVSSNPTRTEMYWIETEEGIVDTKIIHFKPIELTEEWLQKFGFELYDSVEFRHFYRKNDFDLDENYQPIDFDCVEIKYVHQLQNFYFALTGQELEIK